MCETFSGIIFSKKHKVLMSPTSDSHTSILEENNIKDDCLEPNFVKYEITPPNGNFGEADLSKWNFRVDQDIIPTWFDKPRAEREARRALEKHLVDTCLINQKVDKLTGGKYIKLMWNSEVGEMQNSSQVGEMWGNSQVGEMYGNSQVSVMLDGSQVGKMYDNSRVGKM